MPLTGVDQLVRRLQALERAPVVMGRRWQQQTVPEMQRRIPVRTGRTRQSVHPGAVTGRSAVVEGSFVTNFIEAGTKAHEETAKRGKVLRFESGGHTMFRKRVFKPRVAGHPFKRTAALEGLRKAQPAPTLLDVWAGRP